jgi:autotransporter-associated beta strand protein
MRSLRLLRLCLVLVLLVSSRALGDQVIIDDVPSYTQWVVVSPDGYIGCGPTAAGMIIGYWDAQGAPDLIPLTATGDGTNSWTTNQQGVKDMIASPGHIYDYVPTPDRVPPEPPDPPDPYHDDNSVADFMGASRDPLGLGWSYENLQYVGMVKYAKYCGYPNASGFYAYFGGLWDIFVAEIDAGRPMEFFVDPNEDVYSTATHFVTAIGYDDTGETKQYACYDTYDHDVHWYEFARNASGQLYGIQSGSWFNPAAEPQPVTLQWQGPFVDNTWDVDVTANWWGNTGDYCTFKNGDNVQFGDFLDPTATVNVSAVVEPGSVVVDNSMTNYEFTGDGSIDGPCILTKIGEGTLVLSGGNAYTGGTEVFGGTLLVNNTTGSGTGTGMVTVYSGATLGGTGTIYGATTISGHHTPGSSAGIQTFSTDLTYDAGSDVTWELVANTATQGSPAVFDQIVVGFSLIFDGPTALNLKFNSAGSAAVDWTNAFWNTNRSWLFYDAGTTGNIDNLALTVADWADSNGAKFNTAQPGKYFFLSSPGGEDVMLNYLLPGDASLDRNTDALDYVVVSNNYNVGSKWTEGDVNGDGAVDALDYVAISNNYGSHTPEPATIVLLACGCAGLAARRARKRR